MATDDDDLAKAFSIGFTVTKTENDTTLLHPRFDEYKGRYVRSGDQEYRRVEVLERQKKKRFDAANYARKLVDGDLDEDEVDEVTMEEADQQSTKCKKEKRFNPYKNQLMLSEWIVDAPADLATNWIMALCPVGKRRLIVAHKGHTYAYTKGGYQCSRFPSALPGGSFKTSSGRDSNVSSAKNYTIVDCVFDEGNETFWMLDLMCYRGNPIYDSDSEFRFFWLQSKLMEDCPSIVELSSANRYKFIPCIHVKCTEEAIVEALCDMNPSDVDGLLFYHKSTQYRPGRTPLVGWLKPEMLPDILNIRLPEQYLNNIVPLKYDREILLSANQELQETVSDRSFNNPRPSPNKKTAATEKMEEVVVEQTDEG